MKFLLGLLLLINVAQAASWDGRIFNLRNKNEISPEEYYNDLSMFTHIVLGEKHYTEAVQFAQENTIRNVVIKSGKTGAFTMAWEFLNVTAQAETTTLFNQVKAQEISAETFVEKTQGKTDSAQGYAAIISTTAKLGGDLMGVNLSRAEKKPVTQRGIGALDPKLLPPEFGHGTANYYQRFAKTMQGHATAEQIKNYYDSQCLVDDVIAYHLLKDSRHDLNFLVVGSFHSDYFDGAVHRLKVRHPAIDIVTVKIIDASDYAEADLWEQISSSEYGDVADYVYFVNNPAP